jgi:hypothetical protein
MRAAVSSNASLNAVTLTPATTRRNRVLPLLLASLPRPIQRFVPMLPRRARPAMRAVAAKPIGMYRAAAGTAA